MQEGRGWGPLVTFQSVPAKDPDLLKGRIASLPAASEKPSLFVIRHVPADNRPEPGLVIFMEDMAHLVEDDVFDLVFRGHDKPHIEAEMVTGTAASPSVV